MDDSDFIKAKTHPYSKEARILNRHLFTINHKGERCQLINRLCQEGYCHDCHVWLSHLKNKGEES